MSTKLIGDIAEQAAALAALRRGWAVLQPIGDRLPYDLVFDIEGRLLRVQVKCAWLEEKSGNYVVETRRFKTNRRKMVVARYEPGDFDFALLYAPGPDVFYVMPFDVFASYRGAISLVEGEKRQRPPRSAEFREAWHLFTADDADTFSSAR